MKVLAIAAIALSLLTCGCNNDREVIAFSGPQGVAGQDGAPGIRGEKGFTGPQGPAGPQGAPGVQGPAGDSGNRSGSRLQLRALYGEDGSTIVDGFIDTEFGIECNYEKLKNAPTKFYCYPVLGGDNGARALDTLHDKFADDKCQVHIENVEPQFEFARTIDTVFAVTDIDEPQSVYEMDGGVCKLIGDMSNSNCVLPFCDPLKPPRKITKADPSIFVRAHHVIVQ